MFLQESDRPMLTPIQKGANFNAPTNTHLVTIVLASTTFHLTLQSEEV